MKEEFRSEEGVQMKDAFDVKLHQRCSLTAGKYAGVLVLKVGLRPRASILSITFPEL